jgi:crotonobetainyl-CoA:carnitine CoA-transferase CaiB-like acyl-CoA transferase
MNALGGWANTCGLPDREPLLAGGNLSEFVAGAYAATATLAAVNQRDVTGRGQWVDVSGMEAVLTGALLPTLAWEYAGTLQTRDGSRSTGPSWMLQCNDGYVGSNVLTPLQWQGLCELLEAWDLLDDPEYTRPADRMGREKALRARFEPWFQQRSAEDVFHEAQSRRLPFGLVPSLCEILGLEQHAERDFFVDLPRPDSAGTYKFPGLPFRMSATPTTIAPAPAVGAHTHAVLSELLGLSADEIDVLRRDGVVSNMEA